jgi:hypothetical protein
MIGIVVAACTIGRLTGKWALVWAFVSMPEHLFYGPTADHHCDDGHTQQFIIGKQ